MPRMIRGRLETAGYSLLDPVPRQGRPLGSAPEGISAGINGWKYQAESFGLGAAVDSF